MNTLHLRISFILKIHRNDLTVVAVLAVTVLVVTVLTVTVLVCHRFDCNPLDLRFTGRGFNSRSGRFHVT